MKIVVRLIAAFLFLVGLALLVGGVKLLGVGGSAYYVLAGLATAAAGVLFWLKKPVGLAVVAAIFVVNLLWALWEVGFDFWGMVPRLSWMVVIGILAAVAAPYLLEGKAKKPAGLVGAALALVGVVGLVQMFQVHGHEKNALVERNVEPTTPGHKDAWTHYGKNSFGTRFVDAGQITPANVKDLEVAWTFRTGHVAGPGAEDQNTPLQIGDTLYACTPFNKVIAIDAASGQEKWSFDPKIYGGNNTNKVRNRCRGLGYFEAPVATDAGTAGSAAASCSQRIVLSTLDARLITLDAKTGEKCQGFGTEGEVDLKRGMGELKPHHYLPTSAPTVMQGKIVIGGWVWDNLEVGEPSGVIRAFDAVTGALVWAWDLGNPEIKDYPDDGKSYTRATPNMWSHPSYDDKLGLIYLPMGNQTPDYYGGNRLPASEEHSSAVVALDIHSGQVRWKFQTVRHDIWDYDLASQPMLYDLPQADGSTLPALVQLTKFGQIFVLNRATGEPISEVKDLPAPTGAAEGDYTAPTQPHSVAMPKIGADTLTEANMWGATIFDQLACRIEFKSARYEGTFTPTNVTPSLSYPGNFGGFNWGTGAIDERRGLLLVPNIRMVQRLQLVPQAEVEKARAELRPSESIALQSGTPFAVRQGPLISPLGIPCNQPPFGTMTAIDLVTKQVVWERPLGTIEDSPLPGGMVSPFKIELGMPPMAGPLATASGLVFFAGTQDFYLRAFDTQTGKEVWKSRLPVGSNATPMSYTAADGRQFILVNAGGAARTKTHRGDYIIAYALPKKP
jgi:quinate dehydrogenase (quinone)